MFKLTFVLLGLCLAVALAEPQPADLQVVNEPIATQPMAAENSDMATEEHKYKGYGRFASIGYGYPMYGYASPSYGYGYPSYGYGGYPSYGYGYGRPMMGYGYGKMKYYG